MQSIQLRRPRWHPLALLACLALGLPSAYAARVVDWLLAHPKP